MKGGRVYSDSQISSLRNLVVDMDNGGKSDLWGDMFRFGHCVKD